MPQDGHILVTFGSVAEAQADTAQIHQQLNGQLGDLKAYLAPLVAAWQGAAASEYQAQQAKWDAAAEDLNVILSQISTALGGAHDSYTQAEQANAGLWG